MSPLLKEDAYGVFIDVDGTRTTLDGRACEAVRDTLRVIEGGKLHNGDQLISTGEAAEILGVSRRTVTRLLDAGEVPFERKNRGHRRIKVSDVLAYKAQSEERKEALSMMRRHAHEYGMDDLDGIETYLSQFNGET